MESSDFEQFLEAVQYRAFRVAHYATADRDVAFDLVQDAMLALHQNYLDRSVEEWRLLFFRILHNAINDWHRKNTRWLGILPRLTLTNPEIDFGPESELYGNELLQKIADCYSSLPPRQREAFFWRCWEGLDTQATAEVMHCSTGSVKTHYARAMAKMQQVQQGA